MTGTLLLMLPVTSSRDGRVEPFLNCLFTATSATCVTGLVADTWTQWNLFGQVLLLIMMSSWAAGLYRYRYSSPLCCGARWVKGTGRLMEERASAYTLQIGGMW